MDNIDGFAPGSFPAPWWVLHLSGDLDLATSPALEARIRRAVTQHRGDGLILDLSAVTFMDCSGLRPVLRLRNRLQDRLCLRGVPPRVRRLLDLAQVTGTLHILPHGEQWPATADPAQCGISIDHLFDQYPARPGGQLPGAPVRHPLVPAASADR
jgi:anti-anti-sigma factor